MKKSLSEKVSLYRGDITLLEVDAIVNAGELLLFCDVFVILLPRIWVCFLVGIRPKDTTKPKIERKKDYLQQVRRTLGIFSKAVFPRILRLGNFYAKGTCILMKGLRQRRIQH